MTRSRSSSVKVLAFTEKSLLKKIYKIIVIKGKEREIYKGSVAPE